VRVNSESQVKDLPRGIEALIVIAKHLCQLREFSAGTCLLVMCSSISTLYLV